MVKRFRIIIPLLFALFFTLTLLAQTAEKDENSESGIREIRPGFQVFPEGKLGNTLYHENKKLVSRADLILLDVLETIDGYVYYGVNELEEVVMGYIGAKTTRLNQLEGGFYELITENGRRKLFQITSETKIQDLLPRSVTASGLVYNPNGKAAFYHIYKGETVETEDGRELYQYTFKIHVVKHGDPSVNHLPGTVSDFRSQLRMNWIGAQTLQYTLSNNQKETIVVR